jgi:hypothetical protein
MKTPSPGAIRAYSKEYDTQRPAGKNVHEGFAAGGMPSSPPPKPEKQYNPVPKPKFKLTPAEQEGMVKRNYAAGGMVGCKQTRGFGKARRGS